MKFPHVNRMLRIITRLRSNPWRCICQKWIKASFAKVILGKIHNHWIYMTTFFYSHFFKDHACIINFSAFSIHVYKGITKKKLWIKLTSDCTHINLFPSWRENIPAHTLRTHRKINVSVWLLPDAFHNKNWVLSQRTCV